MVLEMLASGIRPAHVSYESGIEFNRALRRLKVAMRVRN
jgi:hypothetical protein